MDSWIDAFASNETIHLSLVSFSGEQVRLQSDPDSGHQVPQVLSRDAHQIWGLGKLARFVILQGNLTSLGKARSLLNKLISS